MTPPIEVVLDTVVVNSIAREPTAPPSDRLSKSIERRRLQVCVDVAQALVHEWEKTANRDVVRQLVIHWQQYKGWRLVELSKSLPTHVNRKLRGLGFKDTGDKLVLRIAYNTEDRRIVSNDADFWDPKDNGRRGDANAPVALLCSTQLGITVSTLVDILDEL